MEGEWRNEFSWVEGVRSVKINQVAEVDDRVASELIEGAETYVSDEWRKSFEDIEVD